MAITNKATVRVINIESEPQKYSSIYISRSSQTVGPCWQFDVENWDNWYWTEAIDHPLTQLCYCELQMIFTLSIIG